MKSINWKFGLFGAAIILLLVLAACRQTDNNPDNPELPAGELKIFPVDNPWNTDISTYAVHPDSAVFIRTIDSQNTLHADFGTVWQGAPNGIPFVMVGKDQPLVDIRFTAYGDESDPGPYPVPDDAPVEGGSQGVGDRHVIVVDRDNRMLYELYRAFKMAGGWEAESGAKWDLTSNAVRTKYWTSADAAGLPIYPGLVRYDEVLKGEIAHALRFTVPHTQRGFIFPARHFASDSSDPSLPPMGLRLRLKAKVDITTFSAFNQVILRALKRYGMFVADNGSSWYLSGSPDSRWNDDDLHQLGLLRGSDFEAVYTGVIEH